MNLQEKIKKFPQGPGVYLFKNKKGEVLYVGRAHSLRRRVLSYFQKNLEPRLKEMVKKSTQIDYYQTDNVLEAIILEANLIKRYWPKYNVRERDYRSFVYLVIPKEDYPRPFLVRQRELKKIPSSADVFGPYQSKKVVNRFLKIIRRIFPYSTCKPFSYKPCFDYQIGLCPGLCVGNISQKEYQKNIKNLILFLRGKKKTLLKKLIKENPDQAKALIHLQDVALLEKEEELTLFSFQRIEAYDISHFFGKESMGAMVVFIGGKPAKGQYRLFKIKKAPRFDDFRALEEVLLRRFSHSEWAFPNLILIDGGSPQVRYLSQALKRKGIFVPLVGISKYRNDKLVFPPGMKKNLKALIETAKPTLLKIREESHRFSLWASRRKRLKLKKN